jgi:hypothetical protein
MTVSASVHVVRERDPETGNSHATMLLRAGVPVYADAIREDDGRAVDVFSKVVWGA